MVDPSGTADPIWHLELGPTPLIATAIHDGHEVRDDVREHLALGDAERLREEDPFTERWTRVASTRVVGIRSRFEVDLNRPRDKAVYRTPEDAWGLLVWKDDPPPGMFTRSLEEYDLFYREMEGFLEKVEQRHGHFVVLDLHTYNHRRDGAKLPPADPAANPQVNIGTGTMDRARWGAVVDAFIEALRSYDFPGGKLDVRENVKFRGGNWSRWIHDTFPDTGVSLAVEFKKFFMDEWTGEPDEACIDAIGDALQVAGAAAERALDGLQRVETR